MKSAKYLHRECLEDSQGTKYFFGRYGYVDIIDEVAVAHITSPGAFLRDSRFSDELARTYGEPQELPLSQASLPGMLRYLEVSQYSQDHRRSVLYRRLKSPEPIDQTTVIIG